MTTIRKNTINILLFILWFGMSVSLLTANAEVQGGGAQAVVLEVELDGMVTRRQRLRTFPLDALQVEQVPLVDRFDRLPRALG